MSINYEFVKAPSAKKAERKIREFVGRRIRVRALPFPWCRVIALEGIVTKLGVEVQWDEEGNLYLSK